MAEMIARITGADGAVILMYHSVAKREDAEWIAPSVRIGVEEFESHMRFLARRRRVIGLSDLCSMVRERRTPARGTVVLTFDDGYVDTLTTAAPVLEDLGLPATVYLPTSFVDTGRAQWVDELWTMLRTRRSDTIRLPIDGGKRRLRSRPQDDLRSISSYFVEARAPEREELLNAARESLRPAATAPRLTMDWEQVRLLLGRYRSFEIGGHTRNHIDLGKWGAEIAEEELQGCRADIERHLGLRPQHFSFPYGRSSDESRRLASECGFESAVACGSRLPVTAGADLMRLSRVDGVCDQGRIRFHTSGAFRRVA